MNAKNTVRGAIFLYDSSFAEMGLAFLFWFIVARTSPPGVVGVTSTALSITSMTISVADLGIPVILLVSLFAVAKLGVVSRGELVAIAHMMLPSTILDKYKARLNWALKMTYRP